MKKSIYQVFPRFSLKNRQWPQRTLTKAPRWCSIDLTAGNNGLAHPMSFEHKLLMFNTLVAIGIKQIEVATPAASNEEFNFVRHLIENSLIPDDVCIGVVSQIKSADITDSLKSIQGAKQATIHLYNSTSRLRRDVVYATQKQDIIERVVNGFKELTQHLTQIHDTQINLEYTPEGFNTTEPELCVDLFKRIHAITKPTSVTPLLLNFNACVERDMPNVFADQIEWVLDEVQGIDNVIFGVEVHDDRGTAIAATELAQLAGVTRVRTSLFGGGERAGVADLVTLGLNLYSLGIDPEFDLSNVPQLVENYEIATGLRVSDRHPYAGKLVFSAFVGHQQYAINQAYQNYLEEDNSYWNVPYLTMDPEHIGRGNDEIIRLTSHSGRTGIMHVMKKYHGYRIPEGMQHEFSEVVKQKALENGDEILAEQVWDIFTQMYFNVEATFELKSVFFEKSHDACSDLICRAKVLFQGDECAIEGLGKGTADSLIAALQSVFDYELHILDYSQHSQGEGASAKAVSYILLCNGEKSCWGVGIDDDATLATLRAIICALNRTIL